MSPDGIKRAVCQSCGSQHITVELESAYGELQTKLLRTEELLAEANQRLLGYQDFNRSLDEALNSGDGSYRP